jgi:hypothetical protein
MNPHNGSSTRLPLGTFARKFVALVLAGLVASPASAQTSLPGAAALAQLSTTRVRITGAASYEVPGVIMVERDRVVGNPVRVTAQFVQFRLEEGGRLLTVPRPGRRLEGAGRIIDTDFVELSTSDDTYTVPLAAIGRSELLRSNGLSVGAVVGIAAGVSAGVFFSLLLMVAACD